MSIHHPDHSSYRHFTKRQQVDKAIQTLRGMLIGISIDNELNAAEIAEIINWSNEYSDLIDNAPFSEILPKLNHFLQDGVIDPDEQDELLWLCKNLSDESPFYDSITHDIQELHGILHGILADDQISTEEAVQLKRWMSEREHLKGSYPYDEIESLLGPMLEDGVIDAEEQKLLKAFFEDFIEYSAAKCLKKDIKRNLEKLPREFTLPGVCATCPEISFDNRTFTFTGSSKRAKRTDVADQIVGLGGRFSKDVSSKTEFLVIGDAGNPCWAFSCYGRKVEKAVELRKSGHPIIIVHESDFWDAVEDNM